MDGTSKTRKHCHLSTDSAPQHHPTTGSKHLYALESLKRMDEFRTTEVLCDVILEGSDGVLFKVHKLVLASCSSYFQAMFTTEMREAREERIKMALESHVLKILVEFAYTGRMELKSLTHAKSVVVAANMVLLTAAEAICVDFIRKKLNSRNCLDILAFAETIASGELRRSALQFLENNFTEIVSQKGLFSVPLNPFKQLISSDRLNIKAGEVEVLQVVLAWLRHDPPNRQKHFADIMEKVRLPLVLREHLIELLGAGFEQLVNSGCKSLVEEIDSYQLNPGRRAIIQSPRTRHRQRTPRQLCIIGGLSGFDSPDRYLNRMDCYHLGDSDKWQQMASMSDARESAAVVKLNGLLYAIGGVSFNANLNTVECYNPQLDRWSKVASLNFSKGQVAGTALNGYIYAVGGSDDSLRQGLKTVERYDPLNDTWEAVRPMHVGRGALGVATLTRMIYACGGANFSFSFASVEKYDVQNDRWYSIAPMKRARAFHDIVAVRDFLYAVGGAEMRNGQVANIQPSIERFCARTNEWTMIKSLYVPCWGVRAAVDDRCLDEQEVHVYIVGEFLAGSGYVAVAKLTVDDDCHVLTNIPYYDEPSPRIQAGVVIFP